MPDRNNKSAGRQQMTLLHVAREAGVSRSTVSLVLQDSPLVASDTRERVLKAITQTGYIYNRGAASLRTQRSDTVGLIIIHLTNPFYAELVTGMEIQLDADRQVAILGSSSDMLEKQRRFLASMMEHRVDGILLCPAHGTPPMDIQRLSQQLPLVLYIRNLPNLDVDYVGADNLSGAEAAVEHLVRHGHERIAFIGGPAESSARRDRLQGYHNALNRFGLPLDEQQHTTTSVTRSGGFQAILELLRKPNPPTAAFCYNDVIAFGVIQGLQSIGRTAGRDFAVIGFDDVEDAALWQPQLTTVHVDARELGRIAAHQLLRRIDQPDAETSRIILPTHLIVRESCGGPL